MKYESMFLFTVCQIVSFLAPCTLFRYHIFHSDTLATESMWFLLFLLGIIRWFMYTRFENQIIWLDKTVNYQHEMVFRVGFHEISCSHSYESIHYFINFGAEFKWNVKQLTVFEIRDPKHKQTKKELCSYFSFWGFLSPNHNEYEISFTYRVVTNPL